MSKSTRRSRPALRALLNLYIETALPGGARCIGQRFHFREWRMTEGWVERRNPFTAHGYDRLTREHVLAHLEGLWHVAPRWPEDVDCIELDIDAKDAGARLTLENRLYEVMRALDVRPPRAAISWDPYEGNGIGIIWQSSKNGGLRYRIPFNDLHPAAELRERTIEALERAGLRVAPGLIEVFPDRQKPCRLPLGRNFHFMYDAYDFLPGLVFPGYDDRLIAGYKQRGARYVRDVPWSIRLWARMVAARRVPLEAVFGAPTLYSIPACATLDVKKNMGGGATKAPLLPVSSGVRRSPRPGYWAHIQELEQHGAPAGGRFEASKELVFAWKIGRGLPTPDVLTRLQDWLDNAPHASKDLTGPRRAAVGASMLKAAKDRLARLDVEVQAGKYQPGGGRKANAGSTTGPTSIPLLSLCKEWHTPGQKKKRKGWRDDLLATLNPADRAVIALEPDKRTRGALGVLLASLRKVQAAKPNATTVAVPRGVLKTIMGEGTRKFVNAFGELVSPYKFLVERAQAFGILGRVVQGASRARRQANVFGLPTRNLVLPAKHRK